MKEHAFNDSAWGLKNVRDNRLEPIMKFDSYCDSDDCGENCGTAQD